ncbi:hypothetical protein JCM8097_004979 [Rhodosporidiobolus ruineniae]
MSAPSSDTSEGVLVSRPPSPSPAGAAAAPAALPAHFRQQRHDSPVPHLVTLKDTPTETVTALAPSSSTNTNSGLGRPGQEQLDHLNAPPLLGRETSAEGVVGAAQGRAPEYIASVRKVDPEASGEVGAKIASAPSVEPNPDALSAQEEAEEDAAARAAADEVEDDGASATSKKQPKWFRRVKEGAASLKEKAHDVVASAASSTHSASPARDRADSAASATLAPDSAAGGGGIAFGRARTRSVGSRSNVSFAVTDDDATPLAGPGSTSARSSLDVPRPIPRIVTDRDGHPVPIQVGEELQGGTPTSSTPEGVVPPPGGNISTSTSVKDKILDAGYDVEPATTNEKFHSIFKDIPEDEELIEDYRCALVRDILVQGKLYVSENFLSFRANILGWETSLKIPWSEIVSIEKANTARIIPNAIEVRTLHATHTFSSFVARDASYSLIAHVFRHVNPTAETVAREAREQEKADRRRRRALSTSSARSGTDSEADDNADAKSEISFEDERGEKKRHRFKIRRGIASAVRSIKGRDTAAEDGTATPTPAVPGGPTEAEKVKAEAQATEAGVHPSTEYTGPEFKNEALDCVIPTSPFKAFVLFFKNEAFLKDFLETKEHLREVELQPWRALSGAAAEEDDRHALKQREMKYIKPLNAPVGPKQTTCNIHDENEKIDEESWISNLTRTRTPDVPSGNDFSVVTRTVFTWAPGGATRVRVTTEVEWTKVNRFLRGVIERGAIDGQKTYHKDLEEAVRAHVAQNPGEFAVAGATPAPSAPPPSSTATTTTTSTSAPAAKQGSGGFLDALPASPDVFVVGLGGFVLLLLFTNLYTYLSLRSYRSLATSARLGQPGEVSAAVERVLSTFNALHARRLDGPEGAVGAVGELGEVRELVRGLEGALQSVASELGKALATVKEVADRTEGVRGLL